MNVKMNSVYSASKSFVDRFMSSSNMESIKYGVTCNSIQLGYWEGGMSDRVLPDVQKMAKDKIGLHRFGRPVELVNTIDYIVNNEYVCGTNLKIDGGIK